MSIFGKRNNVITYTVNKATNRDMYITIQNGEVIVNAPWYFTQNKIQAVVEEKKKKGFMDKVKDFVAPIEEDDDYQEAPQAEKVEEVEPQSRYERPKTRTNATSLNSNTKMVLFEPRSFGEAEEVGQRLKEGRAVVVNLHKLDRDYAQRTIDFLTGVVYALDGKIQKIGQNVILCSPAEIGVQGTISLGSPDDFEDED